ncbi:MAG: phospholipid:lipid A palmitoyltransferase [Betaproteobacteria bacterium]
MPAHAAVPCDRLWSWLEYQCLGVKDAWREGTPDVLLTGYTHHDRHTYTREKLEGFNEESWGGGYGWSRRNPKGDEFGWYGLIFRDSHYKYTKMVGWSYMTFWPASRDYAVGLGYTAFLGSRPDIYSGVPFPGILPLAGVKLGKVEVLGTYIPKVSANTTGNGNVGFVFLRVHL